MFESLSVREYLATMHKASTLTTTGGQLNADDARAFLHTTLDQTGFLARVTRQEVIAATARIEVMSIAARILLKSTEDNAFTTTTAPTIAQRTLTKQSVKLMSRITDEFLHQNIEKESIDAVLQAKFATAFANDIADLSVNGDTDSGTTFLAITNGWLDLALADASVHDVDATAMADDFLNQIFPAALAALPNKWRGDPGRLVILVSPNSALQYAEQLASRETAFGDSAVLQASKHPYMGIEVHGHPFMPDTSALLTMVDNLVVGYGIFMTREQLRQPAIGIGATDHFINAEICFQYGISDAVVLVSNV